MRYQTLLPWVAGMVLTTFLSAACGTSTATRPPTKPPEPTSTPTASRVRPEEYFPTRTGIRWLYKVTIGESQPRSYAYTWWRTEYGQPIISHIIGQLTVPPQGTTLRLALSVRGLPPPRTIPSGIELTVEKDEAGIYKDHTHLFWEIEQKEFMVTEVVTYPLSKFGRIDPAYRLLRQDGNSMRVVFFDGKPGSSRSIGIPEHEAFEELLLSGMDGPSLHFVRRASPGKNIGFTEDTWFEKGKGLVRLEQKVEGKTSMTWELVELTSAAKE